MPSADCCQDMARPGKGLPRESLLTSVSAMLRRKKTKPDLEGSREVIPQGALMLSTGAAPWPRPGRHSSRAKRTRDKLVHISSLSWVRSGEKNPRIIENDPGMPMFIHVSACIPPCPQRNTINVQAGLLTPGSSYRLRLPSPLGQWHRAAFIPVTAAGPSPVYTEFPFHSLKWETSRCVYYPIN